MFSINFEGLIVQPAHYPVACFSYGKVRFSLLKIVLFLFLEAEPFVNIYENRVKFAITSEVIINLRMTSLDSCCMATWGNLTHLHGHLTIHIIYPYL